MCDTSITFRLGPSQANVLYTLTELCPSVILHFHTIINFLVRVERCLTAGIKWRTWVHYYPHIRITALHSPKDLSPTQALVYHQINITSVTVCGRNFESRIRLVTLITFFHYCSMDTLVFFIWSKAAAPKTSLPQLITEPLQLMLLTCWGGIRAAECSCTFN